MRNVAITKIHMICVDGREHSFRYKSAPHYAEQEKRFAAMVLKPYKIIGTFSDDTELTIEREGIKLTL